MSTTRQYSLPNCNLILEGIEEINPESADILSGQPPMSILINAECHLLKSNQKLSGGSVFLTNLSRAASNYAQGFLSGLFSEDKLDRNVTEYPLVSISQASEQNLHRLTYEPQPDSGETKTEIDITTIELFDLVDAIDQFHADRTVLPNMTLDLQSVSKRYRKPEQPLAERLTPVVIGFSSLAVAAGILFMIPVPEISPSKSAPNGQTTEKQLEKKATPITPAEKPNSDLEQ